MRPERLSDVRGPQEGLERAAGPRSGAPHLSPVVMVQEAAHDDKTVAFLLAQPLLERQKQEVAEKRREEEAKEVEEEKAKAAVKEEAKMRKLNDKVRLDQPLTKEEWTAWYLWNRLPPSVKRRKRKKRRKRRIRRTRTRRWLYRQPGGSGSLFKCSP